MFLPSTFLLRLVRGAGYCDQPVCLCVCFYFCLCACPRACLGTAEPIVTKFCVQIACRRGSDLLWRRCDKLCAFGSMDDVTFGVMGHMAISGVAIPGRSLMPMNALLLRPGRGAVYCDQCDQPVCLCVCLFVCPRAYL